MTTTLNTDVLIGLIETVLNSTSDFGYEIEEFEAESMPEKCEGDWGIVKFGQIDSQYFVIWRGLDVKELYIFDDISDAIEQYISTLNTEDECVLDEAQQETLREKYI